jgi:probable F420-dependent oxidoreductase
VSELSLGPVGVWTGALDFVPSAQARDLAAELEALGYGAIWLPEVAGRDPFVHLALLLSATERIVGATGIANIWARDAVTMVEAGKALTEAFPERVLLGLGVSHRHLVHDLRGHPYERPLEHMRRYLEAMDAAPFTAQRPATPMRRVLAALGPGMLRLAASMADGAHPYFMPIEHTSFARDVMGEDALLCPEQAVVIEADPGEARRIARAHMDVYLPLPNYRNGLRRLGYAEEDLAGGGSDRLVDALVAWGTVDQVVARVRDQIDAGATHVAVQAISRERRGVPVEQWRALAPALGELAAAVRARPQG